jgi:hypothetical protein
MNIGFTYPNMYMSEDYNSRQSVYWSLKSFVILGLPADHPFWTVKEEPHPIEPLNPGRATIPDSTKVFVPPHQIVCHSAEHHYLLSAGQMTTKKFKAREAKYGKFAYSSAFGYSVPTGLELHQVAPDSTLAVSFDDGETWKVRWQPVDVYFETIPIGSEKSRGDLPSITSTWRPLKKVDLTIRTTLIPLTYYYPGWHIRVHYITGLGTINGIPWFGSIEMVDSSFAVKALTDEGYHIPSISSASEDNSAQGYVVGQSSVLVKSSSGASGIVDLTSSIHFKRAVYRDEPKSGGRGHLIAADPNTNLIAQRTFIPSIRYSRAVVNDSESNSASGAPASVIVATGVFGLSSVNTDLAAVPYHWRNRPSLEIDVTEVSNISIKVL